MPSCNRYHLRTLLILIGLFFLSGEIKADSWVDPSWKQLLDSSDAIALIQYTSDGDFRAKAKILNTYKGQLNTGDEIWISGFSNHYGPIDKMKKGDRYLVFINLSEPNEKRMEYWNNELIKKPEINDFVEAVKNRKAYYVWTPTSGDLKVKGTKVQYDLIQTTFYKEQQYYSIHEFEKFLLAYSNTSKKNRLSENLLEKVKPSSGSVSKCQDLMKLYLLNFSSFDPVFKEYATVKNASSRFALAQLMGNINNDESKQVLLTLLQDKLSVVQSEAVRQLSKDSSDTIGAALTERLKDDASELNTGHSNIMNPVMNIIDGGRTQIIKTLGNMKYTPAIPYLLPMLDTKNDDDFKLIVSTLRKLGSTEYIPYINKHLNNLDDNMVLQLCYIIKEDSLTECIPSLMNYVKKHNRTDWPTHECAISKYYGLAYFKTDTVKKFLNSDFLELMKMPDTNKESIDTKQKWVNEYISSFIALEINEAKTPLFDYMYNYYGFNNNFKSNPLYFQRKSAVEDSLIHIVESILKPVEPNIKVSALALINPDFKITNYSIKYQTPAIANFKTSGKTKLDTLNDLIYNNSTIDNAHLIWATGSYASSNGAMHIKSFGDHLLQNFLDYISTFADNDDVVFIQNLKKYNSAKTNYELEKLEKHILKAQKNIEQQTNHK